jgi:hypothetical protein
MTPPSLIIMVSHYLICGHTAAMYSVDTTKRLNSGEARGRSNYGVIVCSGIFERAGTYHSLLSNRTRCILHTFTIAYLSSIQIILHTEDNDPSPFVPGGGWSENMAQESRSNVIVHGTLVVDLPDDSHSTTRHARALSLMS